MAQSAANGAALYMRLPSDISSCVSCHGPDPSQNRNNILRAANNPRALTQTLNTVGVMGYLRPNLSTQEIADLSAFLGSVSALNDTALPLRMWPITYEFGVALGATVTPVHTTRLENRSADAVPILSISASNPAVETNHNCPTALPAGGVCDIKVSMNSQDMGLNRGAVKVQTASQTQWIATSGSVTRDPVSTLRWRGNPSVLSFPIGAADSVQQQTIALENPGPMPVVMGAVSLVGPQAFQFRHERGCAAGSVLLAGTACDLTVSYTASRLPLAQSTLQVRSNSGNPASIRVEGIGTPDQPAISVPLDALPTQTGGGCTIGPPNQKQADKTLVMLLGMSALLAWTRRRRG